MKRILTLTLAVVLLGMLLCGACFAAETYVVDEAGLLTEQELAELNELAGQVSDRQQCDVCILLAPTYTGSDMESFSRDYFVRSQLGYNGTNDAILLTVSLSPRKYWVYADGLGNFANYDGWRYQSLEEAFLPRLQENDYYGACEAYLRECDLLISDRGATEDSWEQEPATPQRIATGGVLAAILGFLGSLIPTGVMKSKMNNVAKKQAATNYARPGSLQLYVQEDRYLRTSTNRVRIESDSRGGFGGSAGSHISSGGPTSHGGSF